ncbi:MAG: hypothetical protein JWN34_4470 [Bryobacterales bacterium]|nr:hypothetical protein [Bryobacterales bacterium]
MRMLSVAVLVGSLAWTGCGGQRTISARAGVPAAPASGFEQEFIQNRIAHQQAVVEMARTCIQKTERIELREFCREFLVHEQSEMDRIEVWSNTWYPADAGRPPAKEKISRGYQNFQDAIRSKSGPAFDEALLRAIRLHHNEGLSESVTCTGGSVHDELKLYCQKAQSEQELEIKQMNAWVCQWFKDCIAR